MKCHPVFNIDLLSKTQEDLILGRKPTEPSPVMVEGELEYKIKRIIDSNWYYGHLQYKVEYEGYGKEHNEWLFRDDMLEDLGEESLQDYEEEFYKEHPKRPKLGDKSAKRVKGGGRRPKLGRKAKR